VVSAAVACPSLEYTRQKVLEAARARAQLRDDKELNLLAAKLERATGCTITELAKIAQTWPAA
jgi:hypothetical protein